MEDSRRPVRETVEFARIVAFTDGVFAIAITLLVLSIEVPSTTPDWRLSEYLLDSWPQFFAYFLSFAVIGRFWIAHHQYFALLHDFDRQLLILNLAYLSLIVLVPFPTELLGDYGDETAAVVLYAAVIGTTALLGRELVRYAVRSGHMRGDARAAAAAAGSLLPTIVFYASIPVALVSPLAAQLLWLVLLGQAVRRRR
jgi:uncharacterized membrane protein